MTTSAWFKRFIISDLQKAFHQDNLSFLCLQLYKHNDLNKIADNTNSCYIRVKKQ